MMNKICTLLVGIGIMHTTHTVQAYPEFLNDKVIDNHYHNAVYDIAPDAPYYGMLKSIWSGTADRHLFRTLRDFTSKVDAQYWFEMSLKIDVAKEAFFKTSMATSLKFNEETIALPNEVLNFFSLGNKLTAKPNIQLALTLYLISFLNDEDLKEIENQNMPLKTVIQNILGEQYNQKLDGFFED